MRHYTPFDQLIINADTVVRTLFGDPITTHRDYPAEANVAQTSADSSNADPDFSEQRLHRCD